MWGERRHVLRERETRGCIKRVWGSSFMLIPDPPRLWRVVLELERGFRACTRWTLVGKLTSLIMVSSLATRSPR